MAGQFDAHSGHRNRLRQRVLSGGFEGLQPHEIIEFLLYYAIPRQDVNELAHALIRRFGSVQGVLDADPEELGAVKGVGRRTAEVLALVGEAAAASARLKPEDKPFLGRYLDVQRFALRRARAVAAPASAQLCLDMEGRLLYQRMLCPSLSWGEPETLRAALADVRFGHPDTAGSVLDPLLENAALFGVNLRELGLAPRVKAYLAEMLSGNGAVRRTLQKHLHS